LRRSEVEALKCFKAADLIGRNYAEFHGVTAEQAISRLRVVMDGIPVREGYPSYVALRGVVRKIMTQMGVPG
jgi:hypothetical protein